MKASADISNVNEVMRRKIQICKADQYSAA